MTLSGNYANPVNLSRTSPNQLTSFSDLISLKSFSSKPRTQSSSNLTPKPLHDQQPVSRNNSIPPRSSFIARTAPAKPVAAPPQPRQAGPGCFKTAAQQLAIDRAKEGKKEGITQSSYGSGKRNLGTRPGPAGGFKPPVRNMGADGGTVDRDRDQQPGLEEEEVDPRYKNIDMK